MTAITATPVSTSTGASSVSGAVDNIEIASNFTQFLQLLTTQLKNQNPLDPLDTNQFTQQLVQFAQVEQQMKSNDSLSTLVSLQQSAQTTQALATRRRHRGGQRRDRANHQQPGDLDAQRIQALDRHHHDRGFDRPDRFRGTFTVNSGAQTFIWDGRGNDGAQWPDGTYTLTATGIDASGQSIGISTQVQAKVDSVDLTQTPPLLSVNGQNYTLNQIKRSSLRVCKPRRGSRGSPGAGARLLAQTSDRRFDRALERRQFERLAQDVEAAVGGLRRIAEAAGEQHRNIGKALLADLRQRQAVDRARHHDIGKHQIDLDALLQMAQRLGGVFRPHHAVAELLKQRRGHIGHVAAVLDQQHGALRVGCRRRIAWSRRPAAPRGLRGR